jgi:hypothetical protein
MSNWHTLCEDEPLSGWNVSGEAAKHSDHEWEIVGDVDLDPEDPERFEVTSGTGVLVTNGVTKNLFTAETHRDCELHIEFTVPENSNSGVYLMGKYEIQVLDSWSVDDPTYQDCGGIYGRYDDGDTVGGSPPRVNASRPPGEWQSFDVVFRGPRFDEEGYKIENGVFKRVEWNGELVHEEFEVEGPTRASMAGPEWPRGPLMLQGDHGPVAYRNIQLEEI